MIHISFCLRDNKSFMLNEKDKGWEHVVKVKLRDTSSKSVAS